MHGQESAPRMIGRRSKRLHSPNMRWLRLDQAEEAGNLHP